MELKFKQNGEKVSFSVKESEGANAGIWTNPRTGTIKGNKFTVYLEAQGQRITYTGTVDGNVIRGRISLGGSWTAKRM
jgi:hypothetical protein